jgi:hypothetical protein
MCMIHTCHMISGHLMAFVYGAGSGRSIRAGATCFAWVSQAA